MFENPRYLTKGISERIPVLVQLLLWQMADEMPVRKDYLQIFRLEWKNGVLKITHSQEVPPYTRTYTLTAGETVKTEKIYIIDSGNYSTMLLAEEY